MQASPIQLAICLTCVILLLAKVRDWWLSLGVSATQPLPSPAGIPVHMAFAPPVPQVVPQPAPVAPAPAPVVAAPAPVVVAPAPVVAAPAPVAAAPAQVVVAPEPVVAAPIEPAPAFEPDLDSAPDAGSFELESIATESAPSMTPVADPVMPIAEPIRPDFAARNPAPRLAGPEPAEEASELQRQLADLAARELSAARLRARSLLLNAETQARSIIHDGEKLAAAEVEKHLKVAPRPPAVELNAASRQGAREAHAIGMRKGEMAALGRIEQVFNQIESLLETPAPIGGIGGSRR